jgi:DNA-binding transcriptional ArsR family regulator
MAANVETPTSLSLDELRDLIARWLHIPPEDAEGIDFVLAVYVSNRIPGDPLWGLLIDASGGGKTEHLRSLHKHPDAYFVSSLTENSLISGYRDRHNPQDPSLLPKLHGKVLIIKDLSPLQSMRRESRNKILADLRDAYDGFTDQGKGNLGCIHYEAKFSVLAASTLAVERFGALDQELGERFVKFRMRSNQTDEKVRQAIKNMGRDDSMRVEVEQAVLRFLDSMPKQPAIRLPEELVEPLTIISDFTATARSYVARDRNHNIQYLPRPEVGTRLGKELVKLGLSLAVIRGKESPDEKELRTVGRVAEDCLPPNRLSVLRSLRLASGPLRTAQVASATGLPWSTVKQTLEDLEVLGIVYRTSDKLPEQLEGTEEQNPQWQIQTSWSQKLQGVPMLCAS